MNKIIGAFSLIIVFIFVFIAYMGTNQPNYEWNVYDDTSPVYFTDTQATRADHGTVGNELYIIGGTICYQFVMNSCDTGFVRSNKNVSFNVETNTWTENADLPYFHSSAASVTVGTDIYIIGGYFRETADGVNVKPDISSVFKYDTLTDTYTFLAETPIPDTIANNGAVHVDGKIYTFVGSTANYDDFDVYVNETSRLHTYIYDIASNTWASGFDQPFATAAGTAALVDGLIYVQRSANFAAYNYTTDTWVTNLASPPYDNTHTGNAYEYQGKLMIGSGYQSSIQGRSAHIQLYNPVNNRWTVHSQLNTLQNQPIGYGSIYLVNDTMYYIGGISRNETWNLDGDPYDETFNSYVYEYNIYYLPILNVMPILMLLLTIGGIGFYLKMKGND